jgi:hypothetical protein
MMPHLVVDISAHGFGHVSQTAPVLNELMQRLPMLKVTVRSAAPIALLRQRIKGEFDHLPLAFDFGMLMANAVDVLVDESRARYHAFHADWDEKVAREAASLRALSPDLLFANVPYLSLAAAGQAKVPALAMCSLNWADIYQHYCLQDGADDLVLQQMRAAYNGAECFFQPQPSMLMPHFNHAHSIAPIASVGGNHRSRFAHWASQANIARVVLVAMGGMDFRLPLEHWPITPGIRWIIPASWGFTRADCCTIESCDLSFSDLLASCDAVITKPGYGTFTEAACAGVPMLYVSRRDWPEESCLVEWFQKHGCCQEVAREQLENGDLQHSLQTLWAMPKPDLPQAKGAVEMAGFLQSRLTEI